MFNKHEERIKELENKIEYHKDIFARTNEQICMLKEEVSSLKYNQDRIEKLARYWRDDKPQGEERVTLNWLAPQGMEDVRLKTTPVNEVLALILNHLNLKLSQPDNKMELVMKNKESSFK